MPGTKNSGRRGEAHPATQLTWTDVRAIRSRYSRGKVSMEGLARDYGVSKVAIFKIVHHETWKESA